MLLSSTQCLENSGGGSTSCHPAGQRSGCPRAGVDVSGGLWVVCSGMVIRKGSRSRPPVAFKCWVKPDWVFPVCLPGLGACGSQRGAFPNLCARGTGEFPSSGLTLQACLWETGQLSIWRTPATTPAWWLWCPALGPVHKDLVVTAAAHQHAAVRPLLPLWPRSS